MTKPKNAVSISLVSQGRIALIFTLATLRGDRSQFHAFDAFPTADRRLPCKGRTDLLSPKSCSHLQKREGAVALPEARGLGTLVFPAGLHYLKNILCTFPVPYSLTYNRSGSCTLGPKRILEAMQILQLLLACFLHLWRPLGNWRRRYSVLFCRASLWRLYYASLCRVGSQTFR